MHNKVVLATGNPGKVREFGALLQALSIEVVPQSDYAVPAVVEDGLSFVENAILKARQACEHTGLPSLADDSGLEVAALNGAPGIYSARYAGPDANDQDNVTKLLQALSDTPDVERSARFQCVIVYMRHALDPTPLICQGSWEGRILRAVQGDNGFGYDPVFYVPSHTCSAAQLDRATKNRISHRGQATDQLRQQLAALY